MKTDLQWGRVVADEVPVENGVVNVHEYGLSDHDPEDYLERVVPWPFEPDADCPTWGRS